MKISTRYKKLWIIDMIVFIVSLTLFVISPWFPLNSAPQIDMFIVGGVLAAISILLSPILASLTIEFK